MQIPQIGIGNSWCEAQEQMWLLRLELFQGFRTRKQMVSCLNASLVCKACQSGILTTPIPFRLYEARPFTNRMCALSPHLLGLVCPSPH